MTLGNVFIHTLVHFRGVLELVPVCVIPKYNICSSKLMKLVKQIVPYDMKHNSETDCTDLLMEIERLDLLIDSVDQKCYKKVCLYLKSCVPYAPDPENTILMKTALQIYRKFDKYCEGRVVK